MACQATATRGRRRCPRHDPAVVFPPTGYPEDVRAEALALYEAVGPAEAARRLGLKAATVRSWAHRAGLTSNLVFYDQPWALEAELTWEATCAAREAAEYRRLVDLAGKIDSLSFRELVALF